MMDNAASRPTEGSAIAVQPEAPSAPTGARRHYLDWLRAIAVLIVVAYHAVLPFARSTWLPSNDRQSDVLLAVVQLFESFGLALLFLIAGAGVQFALQRRSMGVFLAERAKRLLVPFVVGAVVVVPPVYYILGLHFGTLSGSYFSFLLAYPFILWTYNIAKIGLSPQVLTWIGLHLWFLAWLFVCSALALPIFALLSSPVGQSFVAALSRLARWRGATLLLAVPIALPRVGLYALSFQNTNQGWGLEAYVWYAVVFVMGYLLFSDDRLVAAVRRDLGIALTVAVVASSALVASDMVHWFSVPQTYGATYFWMVSLAGITGWAWMLTVLGVFMRLGFAQRQVPGLVGEVALPTYVLHFPIVIGISVLIVRSPLALTAKILASAILGVGASLLAAIAVSRISMVRPLLGLRRSRPSALQGGAAAKHSFRYGGD